jgi:2-oxoglutarate dehydrogenase E2 component (dihydrolipoamide succinyltransferase)
MKKEIKVPSLGESISEVIIGQVLAPTGTVVRVDGEILELETDKVNQVLYASDGGKVTLTVKTGDVAKIGQVIGFIEGVEAGSVSAQVSAPSASPTPPKSDVSPQLEVKKSLQQPLSKEEAAPPEALRLTKKNFLMQLQEGSTEKVVSEPPSVVSPSSSMTQRETRRPLSRIRKVIAQRMVEAQKTAAMLTTFNEVDLTQVISLREKFKEPFAKKYGCKLGFMSFFIKAVVSALQAFPDLNSYLAENDIVHREYYDIGVAVGTDKGVIVPVIRNCESLSFAGIEKAIESYAKKAREGTIALADLQGAGFTITNGGVYGSLLSTPIIVPPQCGILGMHKIEKRPVVIEDQIVIRSMMYLALSYDHRLIDGKEAVSFLVHIKNVLEEPSRLLLEIS